MNFIRKISIKNLESHEDTVLDNLSPGLNAIVGPSNSGKSAIVRVLGLIAYNHFDPKCVRHGCDNCEVQVWTDKGNVKVTRGKKNLWEVTDSSGKTSYFDKIGKQILPQVTEILGFGLVKLGDVEMQANIMNQLESHFMLSEFSGQDATGSLRAQVVDEISGLSGIETLIRDVSLDNSRMTREVNQLEDKNREIEGQLHSPLLLRQDKDKIEKVEAAIARYDEDFEGAVLLQELKKSVDTEVASIESVEQILSLLPDDKQAKAILEGTSKFLSDIGAMGKLNEEFSSFSKQAEKTSLELSVLPDEKRTMLFLDKAEKKTQELRVAQDFLNKMNQGMMDCSRISLEVSKFPDGALILSQIKRAEEAQEEAKVRKELKVQLDRNLIEIDDAEKSIEKADVEYKREISGYNELLKTVDVCPLTLKPIGQSCMNNALMEEVKS